MLKYKYGKEYFNSRKISIYGSYYNNPFNKQLYTFLSRKIKKGKLLELGCAYGYFLKYAEKTYRTTGIDISKFALTQAKKITKNTLLINMDIEEDLPTFLLGKKYDIIVALDILEHIKNPAKLLNNIKNSLSKQGILVIRVPNTQSIEHIFLSLFGLSKNWRGYRDKTHISVYNLDNWVKILKELDFTCKIMPYFPTKFLKKFIGKYVPRLFFLPSFFSFSNLSITIVCTNNVTNKPR